MENRATVARPTARAARALVCFKIIFVALNEVTLRAYSLIFSSLNIIVGTVGKVKFNAFAISHVVV